MEEVITDLLDSQYNNPIRVVGFNTTEGRSRDLSEDIADEIPRRCDLQATEVPASLQAFVDRYGKSRP